MFSSCLCSGSRSDLSWEYLGLSVPVIPRAAVTLLPSPFVWAVPHSWPVQPCAHLSQSCLVSGQRGVAGGAAVLPPLLCAPLVPQCRSEPCSASVSISRQELKWVTVLPGFEHRQEDPCELSILLGQAAVVVSPKYWLCREGKCQLLLSFI